MDKKLIIFGNGRQAKCVYKILKFEGIEASSFCVDEEYCIEDTFLEKPLHSSKYVLENFSPKEYILFFPLSPVNKCIFRKERFVFFKSHGYEFLTFISKFSLIYSDLDKIGDNVFIGANSILHPDVIVDDNCYLSEGTKIGHDSHIKSHCFIGPETTICGSCIIGERVTTGAGTVIRENLEIVEGTVLGLGISVHRSITKPRIYLYTPIEESHYAHSTKKT